MGFLVLLNKNAFWIAPASFLFGIFLLWHFITGVVRSENETRLCAVPLAASQVVELPEAGKVVLWAEGPIFSRRFAGLSYEMRSTDGVAVPGRRNWVSLHSSGLKRGRMAVRIFTIPHRGSYVLTVRGANAPQPADGETFQLIFMRPHLPQTIGCILGIILGAFVVIGSIVWFFLSRIGSGGGA